MDISPLKGAQHTARSVAYTGTAGSTTAWTIPQGCRGILVWATTDCYVEVGEGATATTASTPIPAYTPIRFDVPPYSETFRLSAIQISAGGTVYGKPLGGA